MTIEFLCSSCGQTLRVGADAAGRQARCPKCKQVMTVPHGRTPDERLQPTAPLPGDAHDSGNNVNSLQDAANSDANPYATTAGAWSTAGKEPLGNDQIGNRPADVGAIFNYAWEVYTANLGLLIGAFLIVLIIRVALTYGPWIMEDVLRRLGAREIIALFWIASNIVDAIVGVFLSIGMLQMMLKMARQQRAELSDLFGGGPRFLPALGMAIVLGIVITVGIALCIVPGVVVMLIWWPAYYLIVDDKCEFAEAFSLAGHVTAENRLTVLVLILLSLGIGLLGVLACGVGVIFAAPLISMIWCVAYLMMSDQLPDDPQLRH